MLVAARWRPQRGTGARDRREGGSPRVFRDREEAGRALAAALHGRVDRAHALVLAIPRGGVIVAAPVARALDAPLDVVIPHKLGAPHNPELAIGAVAPGVRVLDEGLTRALSVPDDYIEDEVAAQEAEIERRTTLYRDERQSSRVRRRHGCRGGRRRRHRRDVDGGAALGARPRFCASGVRGARRAGRRAPAARRRMRRRRHPGDAASFRAVGEWYDRFDQVTDEQVLAVLRDAS